METLRKMFLRLSLALRSKSSVQPKPPYLSDGVMTWWHGRNFWFLFLFVCFSLLCGYPGGKQITRQHLLHFISHQNYDKSGPILENVIASAHMADPILK